MASVIGRKWLSEVFCSGEFETRELALNDLLGKMGQYRVFGKLPRNAFEIRDGFWVGFGQY